MASDKQNPAVVGGKALPVWRRKSFKLVAITIILIVVSGAALVTYRRTSTKLSSGEIKQVQEIAKPANTKTPQQTFRDDFATSTEALKGKTNYTQSDLGNLVTAALSANALKKKDKAKDYAQAALELIKNDPEYAKSYPNIVNSLKKMAQ